VGGDLEANVIPKKALYFLRSLKRGDTETATRVLELHRLGSKPGMISRALSLTLASVNRCLRREVRDKLRLDWQRTKQRKDAARHKLLQSLVNDRLDMTDIAKRLSLTRQRVHQLLRKYSIPYHTGRLKLTDDVRRAVVELYVRGVPVKKIRSCAGVMSELTEEERGQLCAARKSRMREELGVGFQELAQRFAAGERLEELIMSSGYSASYLNRKLNVFLGLDDRRRLWEESLALRMLADARYRDDDIVRLRESGLVGREIVRELGCSQALVYQRLARLRLITEKEKNDA
jgi:hypothetical protein